MLVRSEGQIFNLDRFLCARIAREEMSIAFMYGDWELQLKLTTLDDCVTALQWIHLGLSNGATCVDLRTLRTLQTGFTKVGVLSRVCPICSSEISKTVDGWKCTHCEWEGYE